MFEDFLIFVKKSQNALNLLLIFLYEYINEDLSAYCVNSEKQKLNDLISILYVINLVSEDLLKKRNEYYKLMISTTYTNG